MAQAVLVGTGLAVAGAVVLVIGTLRNTAGLKRGISKV